MWILVFIVFLTPGLWAQDAELEAMIKTQMLLRDPAQRQRALSTPAAQSAERNANITALGKPENKQEIYNISADLMPWLVQQTGGDAGKMAGIIMEAQKDPAAFLARMPASERAKVQSLAQSIDSARSPNQNKKP